MKERPLLFSAPMVRALLAGTKTQTRRIADKMVRHPDLGNLYTPGALKLEHEPQHVIDRACPYGRPGDRLWVRESWQSHVGSYGESLVYAYRATDDERLGPWRPSIHMPRAACRITLEITGVRVERLKEISEADAKAEGAPWASCGAPQEGSHKAGFAQLWESINGPGSWDASPWVWVIEFKRLEGST